MPADARPLSRFAVLTSHLDFAGGSGAYYRFRLADRTRLPATAGIFVYMRWQGRTPFVVCCGSVDSLVQAAGQWDEAVRRYGVEALYVRLNVARAARDHERQDLLASLRPPMSVLSR